MMRVHPSHRDGEAGFTLIEALAALAIAGIILSVIASVTSQWLPVWNYGIDKVQRAEMVELALRRVSDDLSAAEFVPANREQKGPLFVGQEQAVMFVRRAIGPNVGRGLDIVRIGEAANGPDLAVVRSRIGFAPVPVGASTADYFHLADPAVLLASPFRLSFAYADRTLAWRPDWQGGDKLPFAVRLTVRDRSHGGVPVLTSVVRIHVDAPAGWCGDGPQDCPNATSQQPQAEQQSQPQQQQSSPQAVTARPELYD
jgi:general secretion pathway protein J